MLALHGLPTGGQLYRRIGPLLAAHGVSLLAPDLPGYGASVDLGPGPLTVDAHLDWLARVLSSAGFDPQQPHLVLGHDYGGLLAWCWSFRAAVSGVVVTSAVPDLRWTFAMLTALPLLERYFYRRHAGRLYLHHGVAPLGRDALGSLFVEQTRGGAMADRMRRTALGMDPGDLARLPGRLRASGLPMRLVWGADDPFFSPRTARAVARRHGPAATVRVLAGARHYAQWDRPAAYAQSVLDFLADLQMVPNARSPASPSPGKM